MGVAALGPRAVRALVLLGVELALARGDAPAASQRMAALSDDPSRPSLLMWAQLAVAGNDAVLLKRQTEALQGWVTDHRGDALAWAALSTCAERQGLKLRAIRAQAEAHAALGDINGAIDRLRTGQGLVRSGNNQDFVEASVIDARARELEAQRRQLIAEMRGNRLVRDPQ
jgi:predicted Zn-dependent protease